MTGFCKDSSRLTSPEPCSNLGMSAIVWGSCFSSPCLWSKQQRSAEALVTLTLPAHSLHPHTHSTHTGKFNSFFNVQTLYFTHLQTKLIKQKKFYYILLSVLTGHVFGWKVVSKADTEPFRMSFYFGYSHHSKFFFVCFIA